MIPLSIALTFAAIAAVLWWAERFREVDANVQAFLDDLHRRHGQ